MWQRRGLLVILCFLAFAGCEERKSIQHNETFHQAAIDVNKTETLAHKFERMGSLHENEAGKSVTLDSITQADSLYKIALLVPTRTDPFYQRMVKGFEQTVRELGATPDIVAPEQVTDKEQQLRLIEKEINNQVNAICVVPNDARWIVPALRTAQDSGVLAVDVCNPIDREVVSDEGVRVGGFVLGDGQDGGRKAAQEMINGTGRNGQIAILARTGNMIETEARKQGFVENAQSKLTIVATETADLNKEKAYEKAKRLLTTYPALKGIFCTDDILALGAIKAVAEAGRTKQMTVVGYGNIPAVHDALNSGTLYATIDPKPENIGSDAARVTVGVLNRTLLMQNLYLVRPETVESK